jgi:hypothetical protein
MDASVNRGIFRVRNVRTRTITFPICNLFHLWSKLINSICRDKRCQLFQSVQNKTVNLSYVSGSHTCQRKGTDNMSKPSKNFKYVKEKISQSFY